MLSLSWRPPSGVVYIFFLSSLCSSPFNLGKNCNVMVDAFPDISYSASVRSSTSTISSSRNKKGRIIASKQCRGGSVSTTSRLDDSDRRRLDRRRLRQEKEDRELDDYIDFLIALYCPDEEEDDKDITIGTSSETAKVKTTNSAARAVHRMDDKGVKQEESTTETTPGEEEEVTFHVDTTTTASHNTKEITLNDTVSFGREQSRGGGDDDDTDSEEEAEVLDRYIEFLQEDYENDQALDRYIEFLEKDYDADRALDNYINFLLATTNAQVPNLTPASGTPASGTEVPAATSTQTIPSAEEVVVLSSPPDETVSSTLQHELQLDAYIDQLVTAVELDEYIDRLVESVATREKDVVEKEQNLTQQPEMEDKDVDEDEVPQAVIDDYIDNIVGGEAAEEQKKAEAVVMDRYIEKKLVSVEDTVSDDAREEQVVASVDATTSPGALRQSGAGIDSSVKETGKVLDSDQPAKEESEDAKVALSVTEDVSSAPSDGDDDGEGDGDDSEKPEVGTDAVGATTPDLATDGEVSIDDAKDSVSPSNAAIEIDSAGPQIAETKPKKKRKRKAKRAVIVEADTAEAEEEAAVEASEDQVESTKDGGAWDPQKSEISARKKRKHKAHPLSVEAEDTDMEQEAPGVAKMDGEKRDQEVNVAAAEETKAGEGEDDASTEMEPIRSPNGLYRFLLGKGPIGHVLVLVIVLLVEWVQVYLPQLADLLGVMWSKGAPVGLQRRMAPQQYVRGDQRSSSASLQQLYSGRMPVKGRQRKRLSKQADQEALAQLRRIGDIQDVKYKHVSFSFMQRHGLGPYQSDVAAEDEQNIIRPKSQKRSSASQKKRDLHDDDDEASDVEWVLQGLSDDKASPRTRAKSPIDSSISFGVGPKGPRAEVGFEFTLGGDGHVESEGRNRAKRRRKSSFDTAAITRDSVRKRSSGPRPSDRDGGSGVMGRIRAAATSNNLMSRSLLGAYPGDAVPPTESADARGVTALARKYGYGEWSSDDDDDNSDDGTNDNSKKRSSKMRGKERKNKPRPRKKQVRKDAEDLSFDLSSLVDDPDDEGVPLQTTPTTIKRRSKRRSVKVSASAKSKKKLVRPSLDRLNEVKKTRRKDKPKKGSKKGGKSAPSGIEGLAHKAGANKKSKVVRPALQRLKEAEEKARKPSENPNEEK